MFLEDLHIFETIQASILVNDAYKVSNQSGKDGSSNEEGRNVVKKTIYKKARLRKRHRYVYPPLTAYTATQPKAILTRNILNGGGIVDDRRAMQLAAMRSLGTNIQLFTPIGYRYHFKEDECTVHAHRISKHGIMVDSHVKKLDVNKKEQEEEQLGEENAVDANKENMDPNRSTSDSESEDTPHDPVVASAETVGNIIGNQDNDEIAVSNSEDNTASSDEEDSDDADNNDD